jgi:hypothetical protein
MSDENRNPPNPPSGGPPKPPEGGGTEPPPFQGTPEGSGAPPGPPGPPPPTGGGGAGGGSGAGLGQPSKDARTWAMLGHLTSLIGFLIPLANIIAPLVIWLIKKDEHEFVDDQGKESLNFQITMTIVSLVLLVLGFVGSFVCIGFIFFLLLIPLGIAVLVFVIIAAIKSNEGERYRYPMTMRLIS